MTAPPIPSSPTKEDRDKLRGLAVLFASMEIHTSAHAADDQPPGFVAISDGVFLVSRKLRREIDTLLSWYPEITP